MRDKRAVFFALAALVCFVLTPLAEDRFRNLTVGLGLTYVLLAIASALDARSRR